MATIGFLMFFFFLRGHIDKFCLQVHNFGNNEDKQTILTIKWKVILFSTRWHIIFQHNHRPVWYRAATDGRLVGCCQRRSQQFCLCTKKLQHSSHLRLSRNGCPWGNPWVLEKGRKHSEQDLGYKAGLVMSGGLNDLKLCEFPNLCEGESCRDGWWKLSHSLPVATSLSLSPVCSHIL